MAKYKSRPKIVVVEAVQWNDWEDDPRVTDAHKDIHHKNGKKHTIRVGYIWPGNNGREEPITVYRGDYILTNSDGSISVMSEEEFNKKYERLVNKCPHCKNGQIKFSVKFSDTVETAVCSTCKGTGEIED